VLCRQGRYADAIIDLGQGLSQERHSGQYAARVFLALSHLKLGHGEEAKRWMDKALGPQGDATFSWEALEVELLRPVVADLRKEMGAPKR
jgi:hypothetical protein